MERPLSCGHVTITLNEIRVCRSPTFVTEFSHNLISAEFQHPIHVLHTQEQLIGCVRGYQASWLKLQNCPVEPLDSGLNQREEDISGSLQPLLANTRNSAQTRRCNRPSKNFPIHFSNVLLLQGT